jgi:hypothetical protein
MSWQQKESPGRLPGLAIHIHSYEKHKKQLFCMPLI